MFETFIKNLIDKNIVNINNNEYNGKEPVKINIMLEGGAFNGSYMLGALTYIKELERRGIVKVECIAGSSVGAILGLLYLIDKLDFGVILYNIIYKEYSVNCHTARGVNKAMKILGEMIKDKDLKKLNNKLYINYFNINTGVEVVNSTYTNLEELKKMINRTTYVPIITDGKCSYKNKYLDGGIPSPFKNSRYKTYIITLIPLNLKKIKALFSVKDEKSNIPRVFEGITEAHKVFCNKESSWLVSCITEWKIQFLLLYRLKKFLFLLIFNIPRYVEVIYKNIPDNIKKNLLLYPIVNIVRDIYEDIMLEYCI